MALHVIERAARHQDDQVSIYKVLTVEIFPLTSALDSGKVRSDFLSNQLTEAT